MYSRVLYKWKNIVHPNFLSDSLICITVLRFIHVVKWINSLFLLLMSSTPQFILPFINWYGASLIAQLAKNCLQCRRAQFDSRVEKIHWRRDRLTTPVFLTFPCGSAGKESICLQCGRPGFNPWVRNRPWRRERLPTPVFWPPFYMENSMDCIVHGVERVAHY